MYKLIRILSDSDILYFLGLFYVIVHYPTSCTWNFIQTIIRIIYDSDILINILMFLWNSTLPPSNYIMYMEFYSDYYKDTF